MRRHRKKFSFVFEKMDVRIAKVPFALYAGNSHPELAKLIAEYVYILNNVCVPKGNNAD